MGLGDLWEIGSGSQGPLQSLLERNMLFEKLEEILQQECRFQIETQKTGHQRKPIGGISHTAFTLSQDHSRCINTVPSKKKQKNTRGERFLNSMLSEYRIALRTLPTRIEPQL